MLYAVFAGLLAGRCPRVSGAVLMRGPALHLDTCRCDSYRCDPCRVRRALGSLRSTEPLLQFDTYMAAPIRLCCDKEH